MSIAVVAWCPMIASPGILSLAEPKLWHRDGPSLSVEFARIAKSGALELSLVEDATKWPAAAEPHPTYWALHGGTGMAAARENLRKRYRMPQPDQIGAWSAGEVPAGRSATIIATWCAGKGIDGAVWLAAPPREPAIDAAGALALFKAMHPTDQHMAQIYVARTPSQTQTPLRRYFRDAFGWLDEKLPPEIFV